MNAANYVGVDIRETRHISIRTFRMVKTTSQDLKKDLEKLFLGNLMNQAKKLANLSSSQANESLKNTIASKAPKAKHYSASASLSYGVGTAVLQKK